MKTTSVLLAITLDGKVPPSELRAFHAGVNTSRKGPFIFDDAAAAKVLAAYAEHGIERLNFDYEHAQLTTAPVDDKKSAGTFVPEVRPGPELWLTQIRWTKRAYDAIAAEEWLYFSPAIEFDKDRRVTRLINCALTNLPALDGIPMLTLSAKSHLSDAMQDSFDEVSRKLSDALSKGGRSCWITSIYDDKVIYEIGHEAYAQAYRIVDGEVVLDGEPVEVKKVYLPIESDEAGSMGTQEQSAESRESLDARGKGCQMAALLSMIAVLGLAENASEPDVLAEVTKLQSGQREILSLTGKATIEEAKGTIQAWKASSEEYAKVSAKLSELEAKAKQEARDALLKANSRKFTPHELGGWVKDASYEFLSSYVQSAPDRIPAPDAEPAEPAVTRATLSADERAIARQLKLSDEQFAASRDALAKDGAQ